MSEIGNADWFRNLRFDKNHHMGMGDIRLSIDQQEQLTAALAQARADVEVLLRYVDDTAGWGDQKLFESRDDAYEMASDIREAWNALSKRLQDLVMNRPPFPSI